MAVTTHLCRGNFRSSWAASGGYDFVAEALFSELDVDGFFLEYDDERSGGFEPLRFVPPGKMVVLGLVTTKRPELESTDDLKRRIDAAAKYVPLDQLCLSGQCGFSSTVEGNALTHDRAGSQAPPDRRNRPRHLGLAHASVTPTQHWDLPESLPGLLSDVGLTGAFGGSAGAPVLKGAPVGLGLVCTVRLKCLRRLAAVREAAFLSD